MIHYCLFSSFTHKSDFEFNSFFIIQNYKRQILLLAKKKKSCIILQLYLDFFFENLHFIKCIEYLIQYQRPCMYILSYFLINQWYKLFY